MITLGQLIGKRYRILEKIGEGGMGEVFRAHDRLTNQQVALKCVVNPAQDTRTGRPGSSKRESDFRLALAQEFKILASLRHPNIISVLDYGFTEPTPDDPEGRPYFTMDLLEGARNIKAAAEPLPIVERVRLLVQVLDALIYLHRRKIVHRDLKPSNVMVLDRQVKVLDFGLSVVRDDPNRDVSGEPMGTLTYIAPEVLTGEPATAAADLYAMGILTYEVLSGDHPFAAVDPTSLIDHILNKAPDVGVLDVPPEMSQVLTALMAKTPAGRGYSASMVKNIFLRAFPPLHTPDNRATQDSFLVAAQFIGRETEYTRLTDHLMQIGERRGSAWLVGGESGVGKSRLLDELRTFALVNRIQVLRGQSVWAGGGTYDVWQEVVRRLVLLAEPTDPEAAVLKAIIPDLERLLERSLPEAEEIEPQAAQHRLLDALEAVLLRVLHEDKQPVLILLEDLHWAGSESHALLNALCARLADWPLMIVGSYRDDEYIDFHLSFPQMSLLKLPRLDDESIAALSTSMLGETAHLHEVVSLLRRETEGNVFFMVEVVRALAEDAGQMEEIGRRTLPKTVFGGGIERVVRRRLGQVPPEARRLLELAAIAGRQIDLMLLARLAPETRLDTWLTTCAACAVLEVGESGAQYGEWRFAHDKLREGLLSELSPETAQQHHRTVAETLETMTADPARYATRLAYHWGQAGEPLKELFYLNLAGQQAIRSSANREAIDRFARALSLLAQIPDLPGRNAIEIELLLVLGSATMAENGYAASGVERIFEQALHLSRETKDNGRLIRVLTNFSGYYIGRAEYRTASNLGLELLLLSEAAASPAGEMWAHLILGQTLGFMGDYDAAQKHLLRVVTQYDPTKRAGTRRNAVQDFGVAALVFLGVNRWILGYPDEGMAYGERAIQLAELLDHPMSIVFATHWAGILHFFRGEYAACYACSQATIRLAREKNYRLFVVYGEMYEAVSQFYQGGAAAPLLAQTQRAVSAILASGADFTMPFAYSLMAEMQAQMDLWGEAEATLRQAIKLMDTYGEYWCASELYRHQGELALRMGRSDGEVVAAFQRAIQSAQQQQARSFALRAALRLAHFWQFREQDVQARALLAPLVAQFTEGLDTRDVREARAFLADQDTP